MIPWKSLAGWQAGWMSSFLEIWTIPQQTDWHRAALQELVILPELHQEFGIFVFGNKV